MPPSAPVVSITPKPQTESAKKSNLEKELKLITLDGSDKPFNFYLADLKKDQLEGIELVQQATEQRLVTRQIDTSDQLLKQLEISLRIRGKYQNGRYLTPDINIKTPKPGTSASMCRGEYEVNISDASVIDIEALERKYADEMTDDLRFAIDLIRELRDQNKLIEHFLIDTLRQRRVIRLNSEIVGLDQHQSFYGELLKDRVTYQFRSANHHPLVVINPAGLYEMEVEPLHAACPFNIYANANSHVCFNTSSEDEDMALEYLKNQIIPYGEKTGNPIELAEFSKSGRGFEAWKKESEALKSILNERGSLSAIFGANSINLPLELESRPTLRIGHERLNVPMALKMAA